MRAYGRSWDYNVYDCRYCLYWKGRKKGCIYRKTFELQVSEEFGLGVDISARIKPEWEVLPKRWVVERTLSWLNGFRRLSKDYEISTSSEEANVMISHLAVLLRHL